MPGTLRFLVFANFRNRGHMCVLNYLDVFTWHIPYAVQKIDFFLGGGGGGGGGGLAPKITPCDRYQHVNISKFKHFFVSSFRR